MKLLLLWRNPWQSQKLSSVLLKSGPSLAVSFETYPVVQNTISLLCRCAAECTCWLLLAKMKTLFLLSGESFLCSLRRDTIYEVPTRDVCSTLTSQICSRKFLEVCSARCLHDHKTSCYLRKRNCDKF